MQRVAWMMGGAISAPSLVAMIQGCSTGPSAGSPFTLSADYQTLVAELAEVIIPKTDTPGAKEAEVGSIIEVMLKDCYSTIQQEHFVKGLEDLELEAKKLGGKFVDLSADQKVEVVKIMAQKAKDEASQNDVKEKAKQVDTESGLTKEDQKKKEEVEIPVPFFRIMKELTLFGYFTSEPGATQALDFVPVPGRYDGCMKMEPGQKAYAL